jgi:hypothetical protein
VRIAGVGRSDARTERRLFRQHRHFLMEEAQ